MESTLAERKLHTIELITKLEDDAMLLVVEQLLLAEGNDWAQQLTDHEKAAIQEGLDDLDAGKTEDYEAFMQRMQQKFS